MAPLPHYAVVQLARHPGFPPWPERLIACIEEYPRSEHEVEHGQRWRAEELRGYLPHASDETIRRLTGALMADPAILDDYPPLKGRFDVLYPDA